MWPCYSISIGGVFICFVNFFLILQSRLALIQARFVLLESEPLCFICRINQIQEDLHRLSRINRSLYLRVIAKVSPAAWTECPQFYCRFISQWGHHPPSSAEVASGVKRLKRHYRERLGPNSFRERPLERFLVSFPGTGQEYSRRHYDRNYVQSDRAAEIIRDPDVAMLIV
jgi:hypothetical protein